MAENINPTILDEELDETQLMLEVVNEVLAEHPEHKAACELIIRKFDERLDAYVRTMQHVRANISHLTPGSPKKQ